MTVTTTKYGYTLDKIDLIKQTVCKGSTDNELELFLMACQRTGLDPFMRQIYAIKRWDNSLKRDAMTIQTGIDGFRLIADRTGKYAPGREPTIIYDDKGNILSAISYIKKMTIDGTWHEVSAKAKFSEYVGMTKDGKLSHFWARMPEIMISKCAEALALRKAFPAELSGIYTTEEMSQANNPSDDVLESLPELKVVESPKGNNNAVSDVDFLKAEIMKEISYLSHAQYTSYVSYLEQRRLTQELNTTDIGLLKEILKDARAATKNKVKHGT